MVTGFHRIILEYLRLTVLAFILSSEVDLSTGVCRVLPTEVLACSMNLGFAKILLSTTKYFKAGIEISLFPRVKNVGVGLI